MIDTLVAFGCSSTFGSETVSPGDNYNPDSIYRAYPYFLSQKLHLSNYKNLAYPGESNLVIAYKVLDYVFKNKNKNEFIVIGWSSDSRFPVVYKKELKTIKKSGDIKWLETAKKLHNIYDNNDRNPRFLEIMKERWLEVKSNSLDAFRDLMSIFFFDTPYNTTLNALIKFAISVLLDRLNIPYLTVPAFLYEDHPLYHLLTPDRNVLAYNENMDIVFNFDQFKVVRKPGHLTSSEHRDLAIFLHQYIVKNNLC